jgi:RNA polymerase sigma factor (sigma-70 family)
MSHQFDDARMRSLIRYHYQRNRHLSVLHDPEDLFQDAWIDLKQAQAENGIDVQDPISPDREMRQAVGRAAERAFGKLRKRCQRGSASEVPLGFEPEDCVPDSGLVMDLKQQIESLPVEERLVIEMLRSGYEGSEIAEQLSLSPQTVTRRKQKALEKLRQTLGDQQ